MRKIYEKKEILFTLCWILAYCAVTGTIKDNFGFESPAMLLALLGFSAGILLFVKRNHLEEKYGLSGWPKDTKRYLYFIPMWFLATGNIWYGIQPAHQGMAQVTAVLSMILIGFVEEMVFRGFLFRAMLSKNKPIAAVIVTAVTFGIGHIVNLFIGQTSIETVMQIIFAVSWGFILTMVCYKSGSILPSIAAHAMIDVFSLFAAEQEKGDWITIGLTIVAGSLYCVYLCRLQPPKTDAQLPDKTDACA